MEMDFKDTFFYNEMIIVNTTCSSINFQTMTCKVINKFIYIFVYYSLYNKSITC
jgi:hypothetical protein